MLIESDKRISDEEFRRDMDKYVAAVQQGSGPIAITSNAEVVGFFLAAVDYEALVGAAVKKLLASRAHGPTVAHEEVQMHIRNRLRRR